MGIKDFPEDDFPGYEMWTRRHYLVATVGIAALSGCASDDTDQTTTDDDEELPDGVSRDEFDNGPVPSVYLSARALGGEMRDPNNLSAKTDVGFTEYDEALEQAAHQPGRCCGNCAEYIPDKNGDRFGACAEVEGYIDGADWCVIYQSLPEPEVPEGLTESELATAEVPESYRTASSQAGEQRNPDDLLTQEEVNLMESVDAIADEVAPPGQSCGTCAEFIPDKNGDSWGACARVEGYIAVEDWCSSFEYISDEL